MLAINNLPSSLNTDTHTSRILYGSEIDGAVKKHIFEAVSSVKIASAFCKANTFRALAESIHHKIQRKTLIVRWQMRDLLSGASDLEVYESAKELGWKVFINQDLHAKVYSFDQIAIIGSANLTNRGMLGAPPAGNHELATISTNTDDLSKWFDKIILASREIDQDLFENIKTDVEAEGIEPIQSILNKKSFSTKTMSLISEKNEINLYTHDLFWTSTPRRLLENTKDYSEDVLHDVELLKLKTNFSERDLKNYFFNSAGFEWLKSVVPDEKYFGDLSSILYDTLKDDPAPFRKEVKSLLANLFKWTEILGNDYFEIDQPKHSQRIKRI